jgi:hypothetical protein
LLLKEQLLMSSMDLSIGGITALMFLAGGVLILITLRNQSTMRERWNHRPRE